MLNLSISPPVYPFRGFRGFDAYGAGVFGASRDGGARRHKGLDFIALPGDEVRAPYTARAGRIGIVYAGADLRLIELEGIAVYHGWRSRVLYVQPDPELAERINAGAEVIVARDQRLGIAQDVAGYWYRRAPHPTGTMTGHVHFELAITETRTVDPASFLPRDLIRAPAPGDRTV